LDFISKLNNNLLTPFGLGIAPLFAIVFIFIQFSSNPNNPIISSLILTTIIFPIALIFNKIDYKQLTKIINLKINNEVNLNSLLNLISLFLFIVVALLFTGADVSFINGMGNIGNVGILGASITFNGIFSFLSIIFLGLAYAILIFLQFEFGKYTSIISSESRENILKINTEIFFFSGAAFIVFVFLKNILLNYYVFTIEFAIVFLISIIFLTLSAYLLKTQKLFLKIKPITLIYLTFLIFLLGYGGSDSLLFLKASENNIALSSEKYESDLAVHKSHSPKEESKVNAEEIFFDKCVSCHSYDKKGVGPALNAVIKKYKGKKDDLKNFLLSPVKVDPNFPPMPNQALKPAEAKAIAEYLFKELGIK
jgi:cytochrome c551/c552